MAHYCLHKLHILPDVYDNLEVNVKAVVVGSILTKIEQEKKEEKKAKRK